MKYTQIRTNTDGSLHIKEPTFKKIWDDKPADQISSLQSLISLSVND
jgi:hypothetical protein